MKRDARIGLAVVLVLGLAVTMLVARALYNRNGESPLDTVDAVAGDGTAPYSGEAYRVDGADVTSAAAAAANINAPGSPPLQPAQAQLNPAVQRFVDDQTRRISSAEGAAPVAPVITGPAQIPSPMGSTGRPAAGNGAPAPAPIPTPAPTVAEDSSADHEGPTSAQPAASSGADGFAYTVAAGDNPWKIAAKVYGDGKYTNKIVDANPALKSNKLKVGSVIRIPAIPQKTVLMKLPGWGEAKNGSAVAAAPKPEAAPMENAIPIAASRPVAAPRAESAFAGATHKVANGETLSDIAKKYYGSAGPKAVNRIVSANNNVNPARIKVGQDLVIPAVK